MSAGTVTEHQTELRPHGIRRITALLEDSVLLMLAVFLVPVIILLVGAPIALCVRAIIELVRLFS